MSDSVRRVPPVAPARPGQAPVPLPATRSARPVPRPGPVPDFSAPAQMDWDAAESHQELEPRHVGAGALLAVQDGGAGSDRQDARDDPHTGAPVPMEAGGQGQSDGQLPPALARLGGLVVAFAVHASAHGGWAAHVPLSADLLVATTLHLNCEHGVLTLRFETSDWGSRELLAQHANSLVKRLRGALPTLSSVQLEA